MANSSASNKKIDKRKLTSSPFFRRRASGSGSGVTRAVVVSPNKITSTSTSSNISVGRSTSSDYFVNSPSSIVECVDSLGPVIYTWTSKKATTKDRNVQQQCEHEPTSRSGICQPCQFIVNDARKQFDDCPLFKQNMDDLMLKEKTGDCRLTYDSSDESDYTSSSSSSCAVRIGRKMTKHALRHLCLHQCYLRGFAPVRDWTIMRKALDQRIAVERRQHDVDDEGNETTNNVRSGRSIADLLKGWTCRLVHPEDYSEEHGMNKSATKRRKRRKVEIEENDKTTMATTTSTRNDQCAPVTEFLSAEGETYKSPALAVRALSCNNQCMNVPFGTDCRTGESKKRRRVFVGRLSRSDPSISSSPSPSPVSVLSCNAMSRRHIKHDIRLSSPSFTVRTNAQSPLGLLEELFIDDPWRLLLCTIFLNRTQRKQVDSLLCQFLKRWPNPSSVVNQSINGSMTTKLEEDIANLLQPMGLRKRSIGIIRFCHDYVTMIRDTNQCEATEMNKIRDDDDLAAATTEAACEDRRMTTKSGLERSEFCFTRKDVKKLFFCGEYAADAYSLFIRNDLSGLLSNDHALMAYYEFRCSKSRAKDQHRGKKR
jgi:hypothetical protein